MQVQKLPVAAFYDGGAAFSWLFDANVLSLFCPDPPSHFLRLVSPTAPQTTMSYPLSNSFLLVLISCHHVLESLAQSQVVAATFVDNLLLVNLDEGVPWITSNNQNDYISYRRNIQ